MARPALVGAAVGALLVLAELALDCRTTASEGCVWGRAYLTVSLPLAAGVGAAFGAVVGLLRRLFS